MASPYEIYGDVVEFRCAFGRLFVHVDVAPKQHHRHRLDALESAIRDMMQIPETGEAKEIPIGYAVEIWDKSSGGKVRCDRIEAVFRRLNDVPEDVIDQTFPHQKGGITEGDVFIERLRFLPV